MQKTSFPHMLWAKAQVSRPPRVALGASGAPAPDDPELVECVTGHPGLERRIAERHGVPREHVYLTAGTSLANFVTLAAFCGRGDPVAVESPRYAPLSEIPKGLGARVVDVLRRPSGSLPPLPEAQVLVLSDPHNPTGRLLTTRDLRSIVRFADAGGVVLVDEVYRDLQPDPRPAAASLHPRILTTGSFTKAYGLGALRLGWVLGDPALLERVRRVDDLVSVQVATPSVLKALALWPRLASFRRRAMRHRDENLAALRASKLRFPEPQAGLTALVRVGDGDRVAEALERAGVGVARGSFFGAPECVRVFLGAKPAAFREGLAALVREAGRR